MFEWVALNWLTARLIPGTQAQNVRWVALAEQFWPASTGVAEPEALALALVAGVDPPPADDDEPPLLQAASSVIAAAPARPVVASLVILLFDNISGGLLRYLVAAYRGMAAGPVPAAGGVSG
jgi:hypothetical protein